MIKFKEVAVAAHLLTKHELAVDQRSHQLAWIWDERPSAVDALYKHVHIYIYIWLVVWNIFYFPYIENNHPNCYSLIFFRGVAIYSTNQIYIQHIWLIFRDIPRVIQLWAFEFLPVQPIPWAFQVVQQLQLENGRYRPFVPGPPLVLLGKNHGWTPIRQ